MSWAEYFIVLTYIAAGALYMRAQPRKVGGLWFFRLGRLGGSIYWAKEARR